MNNMTDIYELYNRPYFLIMLMTMMLGIGGTPYDVVSDDIHSWIKHYATFDDPLAQLMKEMKQWVRQ